MPYKDRERQRTFQRLRARSLKDWFWDYKRTLSCSSCGASHPAVIQFHHLKEKIEAVSRLVNMLVPRKKIMAEIAKCRVLCANCHLILHDDERRQGMKPF